MNSLPRSETLASILHGVAETLEAETETAEPAQPVMVSQRTSEAVLGVPARQFLALLRDAPELPVTRLGKLRLVSLDRMVMHLRALGSRQRTELPAEPRDGADAVLDEVLHPHRPNQDTD